MPCGASCGPYSGRRTIRPGRYSQPMGCRRAAAQMCSAITSEPPAARQAALRQSSSAFRSRSSSAMRAVLVERLARRLVRRLGAGKADAEDFICRTVHSPEPADIHRAAECYRADRARFGDGFEVPLGLLARSGSFARSRGCSRCQRCRMSGWWIAKKTACFRDRTGLIGGISGTSRG